jgi:DNA-binding winged helix-turn-helix (wHTH) protein
MSSPPASARRLVRFGVFELDAHSGELRKSGVRLSVQDQPLQVLKLLLDRPGELVTREELRQQLWPSDTFVGFEHGLNAAVGRLRETLGDSAETPRFIETLPRRGYRFIGTIADDGIAAFPKTTENSSPDVAVRPAATPRPAPTQANQRFVRRAALVAGIGIPLACWGAFSLGQRVGDRPQQTFRQLTFRRGGVMSARFTPDGKTVIYGAAWEGEPVRLFSTRVEGPESTRLPLPDADVAAISSSAEMLVVLNRPYEYSSPSTSSARKSLPAGTLARVPLAGGTPRPITEHVNAADWGADRRQFAVSRDIG